MLYWSRMHTGAFAPYTDLLPTTYVRGGDVLTCAGDPHVYDALTGKGADTTRCVFTDDTATKRARSLQQVLDKCAAKSSCAGVLQLKPALNGVCSNNTSCTDPLDCVYALHGDQDGLRNSFVMVSNTDTLVSAADYAVATTWVHA
jgi:hypothetical protein